MSDIAATTTERLTGYSDQLDPDIIDRVAESAAIVHSLGETAVALYEAVNMDEPKAIEYDDCPKVQILDLPANRELDPSRTIVVWMPMARGLTLPDRHRAMRLKLLLPDERVIFVANPDRWRNGSGMLNRNERAHVKTGDAIPLLSTVFRYLEENGITNVSWVGNSYGAKVAAAAGAIAVEQKAHTVDQVVAIEPPDVIPRGFWKLALTFLKTRHGVAEYKAALTDNAFIEALRTEPSLLKYIFTLACPTNMAITHAIAKGRFATNMRTVLKKSPSTSVMVAWGTASELACDEVVRPLMTTLQAEYGEQVQAIPLENARHASYYDVDLVNALILQGLRSGERPANQAECADQLQSA